MKRRAFTAPLTGNVLAAPPSAEEAITNAQTAADTGFMLMSAALVLLMTPGLAFFYGGFVRSRNILNTLRTLQGGINITGPSGELR